MQYPTDTAYKIREISDLKDMINQSVLLFRHNPAFKLKNSEGEYFELSYERFKADIDALGTALLDLGLKDKKVAIMGANRYEWAVTYLAVTCGVGVVVPIDKELLFDDICNILEVADVKAIFVDKKSYNKLEEQKERLNKKLKIYCFDEIEDVEFFGRVMAKGHKLVDKGDASFLEAEVDSEGLCSLIFTSGTTGMAKGVMLSHRNICSDLALLSGCVKINPDDVLLSILPLHHTYECSLGFLMIMYSGACIAYCEGLRYIVKNMQEVEPTIFVTVPLMIEKMHARILKAASDKKGGKLALGVGKLISNAAGAMGLNLNDKIFAEIKKNFGGRLRLIITGAAALNPEVAKDFKAFGIPVYIGYGLTECSPLVIGNNDNLILNDSVGVPLPGVEAKLINVDSSGVGEICVRGPMVMMGYYNAPDLTAEVLDEDGWFKTGDLGTVDIEGHYRITGRSKNVIVTKNGKNIYPEEVEYYLNKSPLVSESIVVGTDEGEDEVTVTAKIFPNMDEVVKKVKNDKPTIEEIKKVIGDVIHDANKKLPKYKNIMKFDIRDKEFLKTTTQKIKRYAENAAEVAEAVKETVQEIKERNQLENEENKFVENLNKMPEESDDTDNNIN
ncbi:MAG: AMP-binding protein [Clostridiales bacterium]|nr:AMP-binding protein [Clostridiales bacterium]